MEKCEYYTKDGQDCQFKAQDKTEMVKHLVAEHGTMEANEYRDNNHI